MITIDGSYGEGGGQILRTSLLFSSILKKDVKIINIRKNRKPPGLKSQHLHSILLLKKITNAETNEVNVGSTELEFKPKGIYGGTYKENIGTAGSITLLLQAVLLPSLFADSKVRLKLIGGTDVKNSPSFDYFRYVLLNYYSIFGDIKVNLIRRGFYPRGGGEVELEINPKFKLNEYKNIDEFLKELNSLGPLNIEGELEEIYIYSVATKDLKDKYVAERMVKGCISVLSKYPYNIKKRIEYVESYSTGAIITVVGKVGKFYFGSDFMGEKGLRAEIVGKKAGEKFERNIITKTTVDENLSDNLVPILSLIKGKFTTYTLSSHFRTNIWVVKNFLENIKINIEGNYLIEFI